jgi:hypothetical protein
MQKHPDMVEIETEIVDELIDLSVGKLIEKISAGDLKAITYFLDNKGQSAGYGIRKHAFTDGDGKSIVPGCLVSPKREVDPEEWRKLHAPA